MYTLNDKTMIKSIIDETERLGISTNFNQELEDYFDSPAPEKKIIFKKFMLDFGEKYRKAFPNPLVKFENLEKYLYLDENYRDHILHTFRVWGLGIFLYSKIFNKYFEKDQLSNDQLFHFQWFLAAVYHDVGYPLKSVNGIIEDINKNFQYLELKFVIQKIKMEKKLYSESINKKLNRIFPDEFQKYSTKSYNNEDHGILSARILLYSLNEYLGKKWSKNALNSVKAIILHSKTSTRINLKHDPLSTLLVVCDELQEWDRFHSLCSKNRKYELPELKIDFRDSQSKENGCLKICYTYPDGVEIDEKREERKQENLRRLDGIRVFRTPNSNSLSGNGQRTTI